MVQPVIADHPNTEVTERDVDTHLKFDSTTSEEFEEFHHNVPVMFIMWNLCTCRICALLLLLLQ